MDKKAILSTSDRNQITAVAMLAIVLILSFATGITAAPTPTTITLTWTAPGDDGNSGQATQYELRYSTATITEQNWSSAQLVSGVAAPGVAGTSESHTVTGLTPGTQYYFAIKSSDEVPNWSTISNVITQSTADEQTAPALIANLVLSDPTQTSLTLGWTAPGDDGNTGTATTYNIRYATSPITDANWDAATVVPNVPSPQAAGSSETITVSGLTESTVYYFAIKTADEIPNWSGLSNIASAQTAGDQIAPATINDLQASAGENQGDLALSWTAPGDDGYSGTVTAYEIRYSLSQFDESTFDSANLWTSPPAPMPGGSVQEVVLTDLTPGSTYYVGIRAWDDFLNNSGVSNVDTGVAFYQLVLDVDESGNALPEQFELSQNYPNPFNPSTTLSYTLPTASNVTISIYNTQGQLVKTVIDRAQSAGTYTIDWQGADNNSRPVASGVYLYHMTADKFSDSRKMVLLK